MWDLKVIAKLEKIYDAIDKTAGPGVVVTIGTGDKFFGTGFNLPWWLEETANPIRSIVGAQSMLRKVLTLGMPSLAVFNGHAYAGGFILGLVHD